MSQNNPAFHRLQLITGQDTIEQLSQTSVIVFGLGGVGSWCAEALVRSGIGNLTIVDSDVICATNINRQVQATVGSVGKLKAVELGTRLTEINPSAKITVLQKVFDRTSAEQFDLRNYDYVVDAIDSLSSKVELIMQACRAGVKIFSALGSANKLDPMRIKVSSLWESHGCPLGKFVRKRLRKRGFTGEVTCVYSDEVLPLHPTETGCAAGKCICPATIDGTSEPAHEWCSSKKQINGSAVHITGTFGFIIAGLVVQDIVARTATRTQSIANQT